MTTYFTSDHHFGHARIIDMMKRPFEHVMEMNEEMIRLWNLVVQPNDEVWHLGDFFWSGGIRHAEEIFAKLNGVKRLTPGNHDSTTLRLPWKEITPQAEFKVDGQRVVIGHYALRSWSGVNRGTINLFGHSHGGLFKYKNAIDVGVDCCGYYPQTLNQLIDLNKQHDFYSPEDHH